MTAVNLGYGLIPGQTKRKKGRLVNVAQEAAVTHTWELKPLSHKRAFILKVRAEEESGSKTTTTTTTTMSQPFQVQLLRPG